MKLSNLWAKQLDSLLWSMFPGAEIKINHVIRGINFEYYVPEYRLAIVTEKWHDKEMQVLGNRINLSDYLRQDNIRFVVVNPSRPNEARNLIISTMNTIYVKDSPDVSILTPRLTGDAGWDIITSDTIEVPPNQGVDVPSNLYIEIPNHLYGMVQARSSTSRRRLIVLPGVIDPAYRGRIYAMTYNPTNAPIYIEKGDRIAQMLFMPRIPHLRKANMVSLSPTERGEAGFGSTGQSI